MSTLLETNDLCKRFDGLIATDHVSLRIETNEIHALIGPNSAGKTTLLAQLSGTLPVDSGTIILQNQDVTRVTQHRRVALGIARSYQITNIFPELRTLDNVALAMQALSGSSLNCWRPIAADADLFSAAREILKQTGLDHRESNYAADLSHGEQRQLEFALALATRPNLLLLDEPMAGLGSEDGLRMIELIRSLKGKLTMILVEHDMDAVFQLADRISVLVAGKIIASGSPEEVRNKADVKQAYLGDSAS